jgi:uncharacterized membrane protein HdeD (DUF308 family)
MNTLFGKYWWALLLRGIIATLFGLLCIFMPIAAFTGLVIYLGAYMLVDGIFTIITAISERKTYRNWTWLLLFGLLGIVAGIITFLNPFATGTALIYLIAVWAMLIGIAEVVWAIRLRKVIKSEGWYILSGILSIVFILIILFYPAVGAVTLALMFGIYALVIGVILISLYFRLRRQRSRIIPVT